MSESHLGWIFILTGIFAILGAVLNWDWFMSHRKTRAMVSLLGRAGARIFYGLIGTTLVTIGGLMVMGILHRPG